MKQADCWDEGEDRNAVDRRTGIRSEVELEGLWRVAGSRQPLSLVMFFEISTRGARVASWKPLQLRVGDGVEVHINRQHVLHARIRRVLGGGEYGVQFEDVSPQMKNVLIKTVGAARAGYRTRWSLE